MCRAELKNAPKRKPPTLDEFFQSPTAKKPKTSASTTVVKIQRRGGKIVQDCDIYIGRSVSRGGWDLPTSKWANPFTVSKCGSAEKAVAMFEDYLLSKPALLSCIGELRSKVLGCWCKPGPCHGDVLAKLAEKYDG